jgi:hypothetical protein
MSIFKNLPKAAQKAVLKSHILANKDEYKKNLNDREFHSAGFWAADPIEEFIPKVHEKNIIWATDSSDEKDLFSKEITLEDAETIIPRTEKLKEHQKQRTKAKAEVFTPSWVCALQNNLVDNSFLPEDAFCSVNNEEKTWKSTLTPIHFDSEDGWLRYVASKRLEITCGEGPYLFSPYDTVTGEKIPVRGESNEFLRIGILDRKFRVIFENISKADRKLWLQLASVALDSVYGYEWQGDNLLLARLNFIQTFKDYYEDFFDQSPSDSLIVKIAEKASWQLWQMDGLTMTTPGSCGSECAACEKNARCGHSGELPLIRWGENNLVTFESFLKADVLKSKVA